MKCDLKIIQKNKGIVLIQKVKFFINLREIFFYFCRYEFQMQYGSIGWSVGALLGYSQALKGIKRVIACIGDGSFQV